MIRAMDEIVSNSPRVWEILDTCKVQIFIGKSERRNIFEDYLRVK
jgi:hypothetical protein